MLKRQEYLLSVDSYNQPVVITDKEAIALNLVRLILLNPGSDPMRPEMGVGLKNYRYSLTLDDLSDRIQSQIATYLPQYQDANVAIIRTSDKVANIEITIDDTIYVYDSNVMPVSIDLEYVKNN